MKQHPKVLSNTMQMIIFIVLGSIIFASLSFANLPTWAIVTLVILASLTFFTAYPMFLIYKSNSLPAIEKYVVRNRKKTLFAYPYALAYGTDQDIEDALHNILTKFKQAEMQTIYKANLALHQQNIDALILQANQMDRMDFKPYYLGIAHVYQGELELAESQLKDISTPWMIHGLTATLAFAKQDMDTYEKETDLAVESARGLQKYTIFHTLKRVNEED